MSNQKRFDQHEKKSVKPYLSGLQTKAKRGKGSSIIIPTVSFQFCKNTKHIKSKRILKGRLSWRASARTSRRQHGVCTAFHRRRVNAAPWSVTHCPASSFLPSARKYAIAHNSATTRNVRQFFFIHKTKIKRKYKRRCVGKRVVLNRALGELETRNVAVKRGQIRK